MNAQPLLVLILISMNRSWSPHTLPIKTRPDESSTLCSRYTRNINNIKSNNSQSNHKSARRKVSKHKLLHGDMNFAVEFSMEWKASRRTMAACMTCSPYHRSLSSPIESLSTHTHYMMDMYDDLKKKISSVEEVDEHL